MSRDLFSGDSGAPVVQVRKRDNRMACIYGVISHGSSNKRERCAESEPYPYGPEYDTWATRTLMYSDFIRKAIEDTVDENSAPTEYCYFNDVYW